MILEIDLATHTTLAEVRQFLEATPREAAYAHLRRTLARLACWKRSKADKGLLRAYPQRTKRLSCAQPARLIATDLAHGRLADERKDPARPFRTRYTREDSLLLAETEALHGTLS